MTRVEDAKAKNERKHFDDWSQRDLGVQYVRGCEILQVLDEAKDVIGEYDGKGRTKTPVGNQRTFRVELDAAQYQVNGRAGIGR